MLSRGEANERRVNIFQIAEQQTEAMRTLQTIDETTRKFCDDFLELVRGRTVKSQQQAQGIITYALSSNWVPEELARLMAEESGNFDTNDSFAEVIRESLRFERLEDREDDIEKAYDDTFEWIFATPRRSDDGNPSWSDFAKWLESSAEKIYWITGKPGAGKSTLTKFLFKDERLKAHLNKWAGDSDLIVASYFSWNAGNDLQKSHEGLLHTLLYQCLAKNPEELVPVVFPSRWALMKVFLGGSSFPSWKPEELADGFDKLASLTGHRLFEGHQDFKLFLIIDGLDEFDEGPDTFKRLVNLLKKANLQASVKICVSSRPENVFRDEFTKNPKLQLEKLTQPDIERYVYGELESSVAFQEEWKAIDPVAASALVDSITNRAKGVFLWVRVVMRELLENLQAGAGPMKWQTIVEDLPEDLINLFQVMWERNLRYHTEASQYFSVLGLFEKYDLTAYGISFSMGDPETPLNLDIGLVDKNYLSIKQDQLHRKLFNATKGILEIKEMPEAPLHTGRVEYMHRTARDWVQKNWDTLCSSSSPGFDPNLWLLKGETLRLSIDNHHVATTQLRLFWDELGKLLQVARAVNGSPPDPTALVQLLDKLDRQVTNFSEDRRPRISPLPNEIHTPGEMIASNGNNEVLHWCNATLNDPALNQTVAKNPVNFIGLMAQIPIPLYVESRISKEPNLAKTNPPIVPILVNAVFGGFGSSHIYRDLGGPRRADSERLDLLRFISRYTSLDDARNTLTLLRDDTIRMVGSSGMREENAEYLSTATEILQSLVTAENHSSALKRTLANWKPRIKRISG